jgi:ketosteroid isomerase-like protein
MSRNPKKTGVMKRTIIFFLAALFLLSCSEEKKLATLKQELIDTDLAFSRLSGEEGANIAFETYCAEEGVLLRPDNMPFVGKEAVKEVLAETDDTAFELTWEPMFARAAKSGDLGYTYGTFTLTAKAADLTQQGTYVSIWIKEDGKWKWALDTGQQGLGE